MWMQVVGDMVGIGDMVIWLWLVMISEPEQMFGVC